MGPLTLVLVDLRDAAAFVALHHRHHGPPRGHRFSIGAAVAGQLVGVVIVGRPVARAYQDGATLEVLRCCTDGTPHAGSMLYGAAWRAARAMGARRLITYTQADEPGTTLRAAGWHVLAERPPRPGWWTPSRPRVDGPYSAGVARTLWQVGT